MFAHAWNSVAHSTKHFRLTKSSHLLTARRCLHCARAPARRPTLRQTSSTRPRPHPITSTHGIKSVANVHQKRLLFSATSSHQKRADGEGSSRTSDLNFVPKALGDHLPLSTSSTPGLDSSSLLSRANLSYTGTDGEFEPPKLNSLNGDDSRSLLSVRLTYLKSSVNDFPANSNSLTDSAAADGKPTPTADFRQFVVAEFEELLKLASAHRDDAMWMEIFSAYCDHPFFSEPPKQYFQEAFVFATAFEQFEVAKKVLALAEKCEDPDINVFSQLLPSIWKLSNNREWNFTVSSLVKIVESMVQEGISPPKPIFYDFAAHLLNTGDYRSLISFLNAVEISSDKVPSFAAADYERFLAEFLSSYDSKLDLAKASGGVSSASQESQREQTESSKKSRGTPGELLDFINEHHPGVVSNDFFASWNTALKSIDRTKSHSGEAVATSSLVDSHWRSFIDAYSAHLVSAVTKDANVAAVPIERPGYRRVHFATETVEPVKSPSQIRSELIAKLPSNALNILYTACREIGDLAPLLDFSRRLYFDASDDSKDAKSLDDILTQSIVHKHAPIAHAALSKLLKSTKSPQSVAGILMHAAETNKSTALDVDKLLIDLSKMENNAVDSRFIDFFVASVKKASAFGYRPFPLTYGEIVYSLDGQGGSQAIFDLMKNTHGLLGVPRKPLKIIDNIFKALVDLDRSRAASTTEPTTSSTQSLALFYFKNLLERAAAVEARLKKQGNDIPRANAHSESNSEAKNAMLASVRSVFSLLSNDAKNYDLLVQVIPDIIRFEGPLLPASRPAALFDGLLKAVWDSPPGVALPHDDLISRVQKTVSVLRVLHDELASRFDEPHQVQLSSYQVGVVSEITRTVGGGFAEQLEPLTKGIDGHRAAALATKSSEFRIVKPTPTGSNVNVVGSSAPPPPSATSASQAALSASQAAIAGAQSSASSPQNQQLLHQIAQALQTILSSQPGAQTQQSMHPSTSSQSSREPVFRPPHQPTSFSPAVPMPQANAQPFLQSPSPLSSAQPLPQHFPLHLQSPGSFSQSFSETPFSSFPRDLSFNVSAPTQSSSMQTQQGASPFAAAGASGGVPFSSPLTAAMASQANQFSAAAQAQSSSAPPLTSSADPAAFLSSSAAPPVSTSTNADAAAQDSSPPAPLSRDEIAKRRKMAGNAFVVSPDQASPLSAEFVFGDPSASESEERQRLVKRLRHHGKEFSDASPAKTDKKKSQMHSIFEILERNHALVTPVDARIHTDALDSFLRRLCARKNFLWMVRSLEFYYATGFQLPRELTFQIIEHAASHNLYFASYFFERWMQYGGNESTDRPEVLARFAHVMFPDLGKQLKFLDSPGAMQYTDAFSRSFRQRYEASRKQWSTQFLYTPSARFVGCVGQMLTQLGLSSNFQAQFLKDLASKLDVAEAPASVTTAALSPGSPSLPTLVPPVFGVSPTPWPVHLQFQRSPPPLPRAKDADKDSPFPVIPAREQGLTPARRRQLNDLIGNMRERGSKVKRRNDTRRKYFALKKVARYLELHSPLLTIDDAELTTGEVLTLLNRLAFSNRGAFTIDKVVQTLEFYLAMGGTLPQNVAMDLLSKTQHSVFLPDVINKGGVVESVETVEMNSYFGTYLLDRLVSFDIHAMSPDFHHKYLSRFVLPLMGQGVYGTLGTTLGRSVAEAFLKDFWRSHALLTSLPSPKEEQDKSVRIDERGDTAIVGSNSLESLPLQRQGSSQPARGFTFTPSVRLLMHLRHTLAQVLRDTIAARHPDRAGRESEVTLFCDAFVVRLGEEWQPNAFVSSESLRARHANTQASSGKKGPVGTASKTSNNGSQNRTPRPSQATNRSSSSTDRSSVTPGTDTAKRGRKSPASKNNRGDKATPKESTSASSPSDSSKRTKSQKRNERRRSKSASANDSSSSSVPNQSAGDNVDKSRSNTDSSKRTKSQKRNNRRRSKSTSANDSSSSSVPGQSTSDKKDKSLPGRTSSASSNSPKESTHNAADNHDAGESSEPKSAVARGDQTPSDASRTPSDSSRGNVPRKKRNRNRSKNSTLVKNTVSDSAEPDVGTDEKLSEEDAILRKIPKDQFSNSDISGVN